METAFSRPRLNSDLLIEMQRDGDILSYLIRDPKRKRYWQCGAPQYALLALCTGELTQAEIVARYCEQTHIRLRPEQLDATLLKLEALGFLSSDDPTQTDLPPHPLPRERRPFDLRRSTTKRWPLFPAHRLLGPLEAWTRWLFSPGFLVLCMLLGLVTGWVITHGGWGQILLVLSGLYRHPMLTIWGQFIAALLLTAIVHEGAHGLTLQHFGGRPGSLGVGVTLLGGIFFYVEIGEVWRLIDRRQRVMVSLAGPLASLVMGALGSIAWWMLPRGLALSSWAAALMAAGVLTALYNCFPFSRTDGYFAFSDWVRIPNLDRKAQAYLTQTFFLLFRRQRPPKRKLSLRQHCLLAGYGVIALALTFWLTLVTISICWWLVVTVVTRVLPLR